MRIAIIGQQAFGKAVLDAFLARGDSVAGVFVAPDEPGSRPDALRAAAEEKGVPVVAVERYGAPEAIEALRRLEADIGIMAYVTAFVPQAFSRVPRHGTIQFHPSLLPLHRGPSSINWPIMLGRSRTGLSIFRPVEGLDEGPILLQKEVAIGPDDTVGSLYFDRIFPLGVTALLEATDLVVAGKAQERHQDESQATYEGWVRAAESRINWANHVEITVRLAQARRWDLRPDQGRGPRRSGRCERHKRHGPWPGRLHRGAALSLRGRQENTRRRGRNRPRDVAGNVVETSAPPGRVPSSFFRMVQLFMEPGG